MSEVEREAGWLTTERSELLIARREGTIVSPEFFRRGKLQTATVLVAGSFLAVEIWRAATDASRYPVVLFAVSGLALGLIPLVFYWEKRQALARTGDAELQEGFGKGTGRFVSLIVRQGDAPTGEDRGMLWFEDGWLYFSGHRTSFGLVPSQVRANSTMNNLVPKIRNEVNLTLQKESPVGPMSLSFGLFLNPRANTEARYSELRMDLDRWRSAGGGPAGQWPPSTVGPRVVSERRLLLESIGWTFLLPAVPALCLWAVGLWKIAFLLYLLSVFTLARVPDGSLRWRALRDRRRLRRRG